MKRFNCGDRVYCRGLGFGVVLCEKTYFAGGFEAPFTLYEVQWLRGVLHHEPEQLISISKIDNYKFMMEVTDQMSSAGDYWDILKNGLLVVAPNRASITFVAPSGRAYEEKVDRTEFGVNVALNRILQLEYEALHRI